jgi:hypothetical protein
MSRTHRFVLGLHPSSRGFGWVLFDGPLSAFDWGTTDVRHGDNTKALVRACEILDKYQPRVVALEEFENGTIRRAPRIRELYRAIVVQAEARDILICWFSREEIARALSSARTRQATAEAVAARIRQLRPRLPKPRRIWEGEHPSMALFCAAACVLTWFADTGRRSGGHTA